MHALPLVSLGLRKERAPICSSCSEGSCLEEKERIRRKANSGGGLNGVLKQVRNFHFVLFLILAGIYLRPSYSSEFVPGS